MQFYKNLPSLFLLSFLISCGDNTTTSPIKDITSIAINESNISVYATGTTPLSSTVHYTDGSTANGSADMAWSTSDSSILDTTTALVFARKNGGDAQVIVDYDSTFSDAKDVHIIALTSVECSDINLSDYENQQVVYFTGSFENNVTDLNMTRNLTWSVDANATLNEVNTTQLTLTVEENATSLTLDATLFANTENNETFECVYP